MAESVVFGVVARLGDLLIQEATYLSGGIGQVQQLQTELKRMQCFLKDADARQDESEIMRQWVAEIRDLAYDAEDIIATYALKVASKKGGGIQKVLKRYAFIFDEGITVHKIGSEISDIKTKISDLRSSFQNYGIREYSIGGGGELSFLNERQREQRKTYSHLEHDVVGLEDDVNKLVAFLLKEEEHNRVASICGMGGLGKTTLAKMFYNHHKVKQHFDCRAWVYISQQYQKRHVWEGILISLLSPSKKQRDEIRKLRDEEIVEKLRQVQQDKKCLVILDDIWNIEAWKILHEAFPMKITSSKILLTSRNGVVALYVDPRGFHHNLQYLNEERSWELLEKIAISWRQDSIIKTKMETLGKKMIGYCGGLPLAITTLGGLLAAKHTQEEWEDVLRHVKSYQEDLQVNKVFALSYNDLPCHLKPCFLYLANFPEDFEIPTKELIRMWMAEGFIPQIQYKESREYTMEYEGERYLWELVQRYMVQVGKMGSLGRIKTCVMHDLMRDFCVSKAQQENFLQITKIRSMKGSEPHIGKIRRLAINWEPKDGFLRVKFIEYPHLRSLLYLVPRVNNLHFNESCFKKFKLLRVLNLENFENYQGKLPKDIGCLIHLRFLSLKNWSLRKVPSSMGNLMCLQTLDLRSFGIEEILKVPNVFKKMKQLRHLYLPQYYRVSEKLELTNLYYLQTLVNIQLKTIHIPMNFTFNHLQVLAVMSNSYREQKENTIPIVLGCPHVYKLHLNLMIKKLPEFNQFSPNLAKLTLEGTCLEEDPMATLEKFSNLKIVRLHKKAFVGKTMVCSERGFPLLQSLVLSDMNCLEEWRVEEGAMPSLCNLQIILCGSLRTIPDGLRFVTTLRELEIRGMKKSFKDRLDEGGPDFYKVQHVPSLVFYKCDF